MNKRLFVLLGTLFLCGIINAHTPRWTRTKLKENCSICAWVTLDGQYLDSDDIEVAAFVGDDCRMSVFLIDYEDAHYWVWNGIQYSDGEIGEVVTFKMFNHATGKEYDYCTYTCVINASGYTDDEDPEIITFFTTTELDIVNYGTGTGNWYLIASPLALAGSNSEGASPANVANMTSNTYDLYYFDQTGGNYDKEWINYKESSSSTNPGFKLVPGKGYLYANSGDEVSEKTTLTFIGAPYNGTGVVELSRATTVAHEKMRGWNLIGNSFTTAKTIGGRGYYRMNPVGRSELIAGTGNIDAMEGIFVYYDPEDDNAANREETVTFTNPSLKRAEGDDMVLLTLNRNNGGAIDRVIVRFDEGGTLPKYTLRDNSTIIYIPQADRDYAVVKGSATNVFPVNFKTEDFGTYTLSADIAGANVDYMHLIDKITGEDVDMLLEGEYSFVAAPVDREDRFILRLTYSGYFDNESDIFAYQNGSDIVVCGEGTLQVFDVMGRYVTSYEVNGVQSIQAMPMGVYIFRMLGDDVKTQKIYVR